MLDLTLGGAGVAPLGNRGGGDVSPEVRAGESNGGAHPKSFRAQLASPEGSGLQRFKKGQ